MRGLRMFDSSHLIFHRSLVFQIKEEFSEAKKYGSPGYLVALHPNKSRRCLFMYTTAPKNDADSRPGAKSEWKVNGR